MSDNALRVLADAVRGLSTGAEGHYPISAALYDIAKAINDHGHNVSSNQLYDMAEMIQNGLYAIATAIKEHK